MAEAVGFEPTCPCGQLHFECSSLQPLRYASISDYVGNIAQRYFRHDDKSTLRRKSLSIIPYLFVKFKYAQKIFGKAPTKASYGRNGRQGAFFAPRRPISPCIHLIVWLFLAYPAYFRFSGFKPLSSSITNKPSLRISTSSNQISPPPYSGR